ncbi:MAG: DUF4416 family protein [bacterium]
MEYEPVLPLVSILSSSPGHMRAGINKLTATWDNIVVSSPPFLFDQSDYYEEELGSPLFRWWAYRETLANPARLIDWKNTCADIEQQLSDPQGRRTVNIDPGYLNFGLVVLGSFKYDLQKIYLGNKVYADPALQFGEGQYQPFPWSFPDFKQPDYYKRLKKFRDRYKELRKS